MDSRKLIYCMYEPQYSYMPVTMIIDKLTEKNRFLPMRAIATHRMHTDKKTHEYGWLGETIYSVTA